MQHLARPIAALALGLALAACSAGDEKTLGGQRLTLQGEVVGAGQEDRVAAISLPAAQSYASWTAAAGSASHSTRHNAFTAGVPQLAWVSDIGAGNSRKTRITAEPVAANGRVVTFDALATVTATNAVTGDTLWSRDLTPPADNTGDASSGELAIGGDTVYATTGFGDLVALDLSSGAEIWRQRLDAAGGAAPVVSGDLVYVVGADNRAWAIEAANGRVRWQIEGLPNGESVVGSSAPAVNDRLVVFPSATGDLRAVFRKGGVPLWDAAIAGQRKGVVYANTGDISSGPVILGDTVYAGTQAGRIAAFDVNSGARKWTATEGAYSPVAVAGGAVFLLSDRGELVRLSAADGTRVWGTQLGTFTTDRPRRHKAVYAHFGPVLGGGRIWVASSDGFLRGFAPESGNTVVEVALPAPAAAEPIVVGGVMYVVLENGTLAAIR